MPILLHGIASGMAGKRIGKSKQSNSVSQASSNKSVRSIAQVPVREEGRIESAADVPGLMGILQGAGLNFGVIR